MYSVLAYFVHIFIPQKRKEKNNNNPSPSDSPRVLKTVAVYGFRVFYSGGVRWCNGGEHILGSG